MSSGTEFKYAIKGRSSILAYFLATYVFFWANSAFKASIYFDNLLTFYYYSFTLLDYTMRIECLILGD